MAYKEIDPCNRESLKKNLWKIVKFTYDFGFRKYFSEPAIQKIEGMLTSIRESRWPHRPYPVVEINSFIVLICLEGSALIITHSNPFTNPNSPDSFLSV